MRIGHHNESPLDCNCRRTFPVADALDPPLFVYIFDWLWLCAYVWVFWQK